MTTYAPALERQPPVTGGEIALLTGVISLLSALGGYAAKALPVKWQANVEQQKALNAGETEDNRHEETVIKVLFEQVAQLNTDLREVRRESSDKAEVLRMEIQHLTSLNAQTDAKLATVTEQLVSARRELEEVKDRNSRLESENVTLRGRVTTLTEQVGSLRLELARHDIQCPEHLGGAA